MSLLYFCSYQMFSINPNWNLEYLYLSGVCHRCKSFFLNPYICLHCFILSYGGGFKILTSNPTLWHIPFMGYVSNLKNSGWTISALLNLKLVRSDQKPIFLLFLTGHIQHMICCMKRSCWYESINAFICCQELIIDIAMSVSSVIWSEDLVESRDNSQI